MQATRKPEQLNIALQLLRWTLLIIPLAVVIGLMVALFLWLLERATETRWEYPWIIYGLPLAGIVIYYAYRAAGKNAEAGNNLILEEIHQPGGGVPARMTPLILIATVVTHLFGGSAGREGTAVQMGGSLSALFARWIKIHHEQKRILLMCGMSAGFGAVFGTPVAGTIFALEVLTIGRIKYDALIPCLIAAVIADFTCTATGIQHTHYAVSFKGAGEPMLLLKVIIAGILFGFAGWIFVQLSHLVKEQSNRLIPVKWLIPAIGGVLVIGISFALGSFDYLGLGVQTADGSGVSIVNAFKEGGAEPLSWFWKILLTAITLGMGFKGGEVTPLFFIGATLGNTLAWIGGAPVDLMAALGFIAVFAGATNTPLACTIMGVELFGSDNILYYAVACFTAYYFSGHSGIYKSQRTAVAKSNPG